MVNIGSFQTRNWNYQKWFKAVYHSRKNKSLLTICYLMYHFFVCVMLMPLHISQTDNLYCLKFSSKRKGRKESVNKSNCENVTTELHHFFKVLYLVNTNKIIFFLLLAITSQHFKARHCLCFVIYNSNIYTPYTVFKVDHFNKICLFNAFLTACNFLAARTCYWKMAILMVLKGRLIFPRRLFHYLRKILVCFLFYMYMYLIIVQ